MTSYYRICYSSPLKPGARNMNSTPLSAAIKGIRTQLGLTQEELARRLGVSFTTVNRWEKSRSRPQPFILRQLSTLGVDAGVTVHGLLEGPDGLGSAPRVWSVETLVGPCRVALSNVSDVLEPTVFARVLLQNLSVRESDKTGNVLDMGTGSGVLAIALARIGCQNVHSVDVSQSALRACRENAETNGLTERITTIHSDLDRALNVKYDLVVANPPTFARDHEVMKHEPIDLSFFTNDDGHDFVDRLARSAPRLLADGGRLVIVHPSYLDRSRLDSILGQGGLKAVTIASQQVSLRIYSEVFRKYDYDAGAIFRKLIESCRGQAAQDLLNEIDKGEYSFVLDVVEASARTK